VGGPCSGDNSLNVRRLGLRIDEEIQGTIDKKFATSRDSGRAVIEDNGDVKADKVETTSSTGLGIPG
jgi:hypothetical protein